MGYDATQRWRVKAKYWIIRYMGGRCMSCGYDKYHGNLSGHHLKDKVETLSRLINKCVSWGKIIEEADKCVLLCHNCHGEVHAGIRKVPKINVKERKKILKQIELEKPIAMKHRRHSCPSCGKETPDTRVYCSLSCSCCSKEKTKWPDNLPELVTETSMVRVAKDLGVSDKAIAKRLKNHHEAREFPLEVVRSEDDVSVRSIGL